jgi:hypothetical protein
VLPVVQLVIPIGFGREEFGILTWAGERLRFERLRFLGTAPAGNDHYLLQLWRRETRNRKLY